ncbi:hypothetical protein [Planotetraspora kaengkrachanensis]|uniref:DUF3558 domain-containing protein n=1 Tax=Planotetraspora kaengkrachanensis TaxID=575193 RepID=A0A8J3PZ75_9ACTN|nr:hypothetical protein [Planotetraspora kaengkrachanensis]GIG83616.1 hypothetical protein Pka01_67430 [Planotetraspora kaengkrachanensis]
MNVFRKFTQAAILAGALALVTACGGGGSGDSSPVSLPGVNAPAGEGSGDSDASCDFLTKDEVADVIGPNDGGQHDYTFGGCVWTASSAKDGFNEAIFAAVLPKAQYESVAEIGEPLSGFVEGATYDATHGELWFPCRGGDYCGIKVRTASSDGRQEAGLRLAEILQGRV